MKIIKIIIYLFLGILLAAIGLFIIFGYIPTMRHCARLASIGQNNNAIRYELCMKQYVYGWYSP